jgi:hypothetical protein
MSRSSPVPVNLVSVTNFNDIIGTSIGTSRITSSLIDEVYRINISQSGVLGVISGQILTDNIDRIPSEGGSIRNSQAINNFALGISYTLARDSNGNNILDSSDQFIDYKVISSNVNGFVLFQKSVTAGTYFLELTDTNGEYTGTTDLTRVVATQSRSNSGILFDPGTLYGEPTTNPPTGDPLNPPTNPPTGDPLNPPTNPPIGDPLTSPVYRFYNAQSKGHFFTTSTQERDTVLANPQWQYTFEGVGFQASASAGTNLLPVYRFYNPISKGHFFTTDEAEKNNVLANPQWRYNFEGVGFYTYGASASLGSDVYRFYNPISRGHFFTISEAERNNVLANPQWQYTAEGVGFEAKP